MEKPEGEPKKMQYWCVDFYKEDGCCLSCSNSEEGCLCFNCKCTVCYWYSSPNDYCAEKGYCDLVSELKKRKRNLWIEDYSKSIKKEKLNKNNGQTDLNDFK